MNDIGFYFGINIMEEGFILLKSVFMWRIVWKFPCLPPSRPSLKIYFQKCLDFMSNKDAHTLTGPDPNDLLSFDLEELPTPLSLVACDCADEWLDWKKKVKG